MAVHPDGDVNDPEHATDSAGRKAHGTHGKGDSREERVDDDAPQPDLTKGYVAGSDGWGDAASGGSSVDKRPPA